jgi:hypothetical protein
MRSKSVTPACGGPVPPSRDKHVSLVGTTRDGRHFQSRPCRLAARLDALHGREPARHKP